MPSLRVAEGPAAAYRVLHLPGDVTERLRAEAAALEFVHHKSDKYGVKPAEARITSSFDMATTEGNGFCRELAESDILHKASDALLGVPTVLSSCTYILYGVGSFIGIHTDRPGCEVNALILLGGGPAVAEFRPFKPGETVRDLLAVCRSNGGFVGDCITAPLAAQGDSVLFRATELPHQRRPCAEPLLLLSVCYGPQ